MTSVYPKMREFCGRQVVGFGPNGKKGEVLIQDLISLKAIKVDGCSGVKKERPASGSAVKPGDKLVLPSWAVLKKTGDDLGSLNRM